MLCKLAKGCLVSVGDVKETIRVLSLVVNFAHQSVYINVRLPPRKFGGLTCFEQILAIDEEVETIVLWKVDPFSDNEVELVCA